MNEPSGPDAPCPVFSQCGGCAYQDVSYQYELQIKQQRIVDCLSGVLQRINGIIDPVVASPKIYHYRSRIDLKVVRTKDERVLVGFSPIKAKDGTRQPFGLIPIEACYIAEECISKKIPEIINKSEEILTGKYRRGNLVVRCGEEGRVLSGGIGKKSLQLDEGQYFFITLNGLKIYYSLDTFFQSNAAILPLLFSLIRSFDIWDKQTVFLDLYGGVGLFAIGISDLTGEIYLIEESVTSIAMAKYNKKANKLEHLHICEGKVEDRIEEVLAQTRAKKKVAMIDPPRCGLSKSAREFMADLKGVDHLMYLSCNPEALAVDLKTFIERGWQIERITPFDFFPRTPHLETLVLLKAKSK